MNHNSNETYRVESTEPQLHDAIKKFESVYGGVIFVEKKFRELKFENKYLTGQNRQDNHLSKPNDEIIIFALL